MPGSKEIRVVEALVNIEGGVVGLLDMSELEKTIDGLQAPTPIKTKVKESIKGMIREVAFQGNTDRIIVLGESEIDEFLDEVSRRVYGFSIDSLSSQEKMELARVKNALFQDIIR